MALEHQDRLHEDNLAFIEDPKVREAYIYLVRCAGGLSSYRCYPNMKGKIRIFRYCKGQEQPFAFIVNRQSLLFYFRKPSLGHKARSIEYLSKRFTEVGTPRPDEITFRINNISDAEVLMKDVFGLADAERSLPLAAPQTARHGKDPLGSQVKRTTSTDKRDVGRIATAFCNAAKVSRADVFGGENDRWQPANLQDDACLPFLGYVGPNYRPGGVVLMAINPGGGSEKYKQRTAEDELLCPALQQLRDSSPATAAAAVGFIFQTYIKVLPTWNLWRIVFPVLQAINTDTHAIAFLNAVPFRTKGDGNPPVYAQKASWEHIIDPLLSTLEPSMIIALGKKAGVAIERYRAGDWQLVTVPRTNGDSYVSLEAKSVLAALSREG